MARPRSERAHEQVLDAAQSLFFERGVEATSMDSVATASGVSKATIYKHWPDKDALCLEVLGRLQTLPEFNSGDIRKDILALLSYHPPQQTDEMQSRMMTHLGAYASRNEAFGKAWRRKVLEPPRTQLAQLLKRAVEQRFLCADLDIDVGVAQLLGPMIYRKLLGFLGTPLPAEMPEQIVNSFWRAYARDTGRVVNRRRPR